MKSQFDSFLIAKLLPVETKSADIKTAIAPDHFPFKLSVRKKFQDYGNLIILYLMSNVLSI